MPDGSDGSRSLLDGRTDFEMSPPSPGTMEGSSSSGRWSSEGNGDYTKEKIVENLTSNVLEDYFLNTDTNIRMIQSSATEDSCTSHSSTSSCDCHKSTTATQEGGANLVHTRRVAGGEDKEEQHRKRQEGKHVATEKKEDTEEEEEYDHSLCSDCTVVDDLSRDCLMRLSSMHHKAEEAFCRLKKLLDGKDELLTISQILQQRL